MEEKDKNVKLTVITVCYNAESVIGCTLDSLGNQVYDQYELVIVDGKSCDRTMEIIHEKQHMFNQCRIISEPDDGIYNAMNKGVSMASGEYVYFLNAGDKFFDTYVLEKVMDHVMSGVDIVYGNMIYGEELKRYTKKLSKQYFLSEHMICHQAIFAKKKWLRKYPFEEKYKLCADRHWLYQCIKEGCVVRHMAETIGYYDTNGKSADLDEFKKDSLRVIRDDFGVGGVLYVKLKRLAGSIARRIIERT